MQLVDPAAFYGKEEFAAEVDRLIGFLRDCPLAGDADEISLPGDRSRRTLATRRERGVPVEEGAWSELVRLALQLKVATPSLDNSTPTRSVSEGEPTGQRLLANASG
jgi:LDH2 family malate/lactate/ureidoglycolate dehydrogenase